MQRVSVLKSASHLTGPATLHGAILPPALLLVQVCLANGKRGESHILTYISPINAHNEAPSVRAIV